jgi:hypothetical protein
MFRFQTQRVGWSGHKAASRLKRLAFAFSVHRLELDARASQVSGRTVKTAILRPVDHFRSTLTSRRFLIRRELRIRASTGLVHRSK